MIGTTLGVYHITQHIGRGGMADVYLAEDNSIGRQVAVKVLPAEFLCDPNFLRRFEREVKIIASLQHSSILPVFNYGQEGGQPYIVMAYLPGGTLADEIARTPGGLPLERIAYLLDRLGSALDYAHKRGVVHRDFKPSNVLLDEEGHPYIADFGIAKAASETAALTGSGIIGTPNYMAPEMAYPDSVTALIDVYALGVSLYQMLTGQVPYRADTPMGVLMAHATRPIPDPRALRREVPPGVALALRQALAKQPDARTSSAGALAAAFRAGLAGGPDTQRIADQTQVEGDPGLTAVEMEPEAMTVPAPQATHYGAPWDASPAPRPPEPAPASDPTRRPAPQQRRLNPLWLLGGGLLTVVIVGLILFNSPVPAAAPIAAAPTAAAPTAAVPTAAVPTAAVPTAAVSTPAATTAAALTTTLDFAPVLSAADCESAGLPGDACTGVVRNAEWTPYTEVINGVEMALVPAGCFMMGSEDGVSDESPVHEVCFEEPFWIDLTEVTNGQFATFNGQAGRSSNWADAERPRESITWAESAAFCELRGARLPTEAEWEFAARGPDGLVYPWGNEFKSENVVYFGNSGNRTWGVGSMPAGASWVGALDLSGNVYEWVNDWYGAYPSEGQVNPQGDDNGTYRVMRGGSWLNTYSNYLRGAYRTVIIPSFGANNYGFRCAHSY